MKLAKEGHRPQFNRVRSSIQYEEHEITAHLAADAATLEKWIKEQELKTLKLESGGA